MKKQGIGFLVWGGIIAVFTIYPLLLSPIEYHEGITFDNIDRIIATTSVGMKILTILGGIISILICYLFYSIAKTKNKQILIARLIGYLFFAFGSFIPQMLTHQFVEDSVLKPEGFENPFSNSFIIVFIIMSVVSLIAAYFLIFETKKPTIKIDTVKHL